jgi:dipeptidyl aminopeptidase/acylaminoacyl peptidase
LTDGFNKFPEWSPDGKYIAFKHVDDDDGPTDSGQVWVVASDSEHVRIREIGNTANAVPLKVGDNGLRVFGSFSWR